MPVLNLVDEMPATDRDPDGHRYPWIRSIVDNGGTRTPSTGRQPLGLALDAGRLLVPGDRVTFRCEGIDPHGRELRWWVHPFGVEPTPPIRGNRVELTWVVEPASAGARVYVGIGMAAESRHHRQGGLDGRGYDGWVLYYYQVVRDAPPPDLPQALAKTARSTHRARRSPKGSPLVQPGRLLSVRPW